MGPDTALGCVWMMPQELSRVDDWTSSSGFLIGLYGITTLGWSRGQLPAV
jgi:hypothetical protein